MAELTRQELTEQGIAKVEFNNADAAGDTIENPEGSTVVIVKNESATPRTVTINPIWTSREDRRYGTIEKPSVKLKVQPGETGVIGYLKQESFNIANSILINYDNATGVKVAALVRV